MSKENKAEMIDLIATATKVPEDKRDYILGYMQCMVDMDEQRKDED